MIDFNKKIYNSDKFRQAAIFFKEHGAYTLAPPGTTDYIKYWDEETNRCLYGYVAPDGDAISGYNYFYLNYSPIMKLSEVEYTDRYGNKRTRRERILEFPNFWDYDYYYFNAIEEAETEGKHLVVLKSRQRGYSFKGASMLVRNYELIPGSKSFAVASEQKFLIGDGLLTKAWQIMDFIDKHTAWSKQRLTSTRMERVSGFKITDEFGKQTEQGYLSSITGITLKNDPERLRGTRGKLVLFEEGGKFPNLETAWRVEQPAVETDDGVAFGLLIAFGTGGTEGCVMAGSKVYSSDGRLLNIEDIHMSDGIASYNEQQQKPVSEQIQHIGDLIDKQCVHIETKQYRNLSCSIDHPIYASNRVDSNECRIWEWIDAGDLKVGDLIAVSQSIPNFTNNTMFDPYLIGLLIGDGTYNGTPVLTNCDEDVLSYVTNKYKCTDRKKQTPTKDGRMLRSISVLGIRNELRNIGIYGQTKLNKRLPDCIFSSRESDCCELLAGLIDTDGNVNIRKGAGNRMPYAVVLISTICLEMAKQIRDLYQKLGIHASIQKKQQRNRNREIKDVNPYYNVEVVDKDSLIQLCTKIKPKIKYKKDKLNQILNICTSRKRWRKQKFEYETISNIKDLGLQTVYNIQVSNTQTYIVNGIITHNSSFDGLKNLFYKPEAFNCLTFPNIWDDGQEQTKCGFFVPSWSNMESTDDNGKQRFMDQYGNSLKEKAIEELIAQRNKVKDGGASQTSIDRFISERPLKPQEAVLELGKNIFPRQLLMNQLTRIRTNEKLRNMKHVVDLAWDGEGQVKATEKKSGDITTYHLKKDDKPHGSIVIWEYPIKDPPFGLYIGGCDPYDHDESFTNSLGSTFIFKRVKAGEAWNDVIVAEYSGRPDTAEEYYENVRKLLIFYNARLLFENERKGIYPYFTNKHCDYLLADQPDKIISEVFKDSKVQRRKGCHMTKSIRAYGEGLILEWLMDEFEPGHPNIERIYSEPLIEELIENDGVKNVDRVIALCMTMMYREELYQVKVAKSKEENKQVELFEMPLFGQSWWNDEQQQDDIPVYTF